MSLSDPLADMLTRVRNGQNARLSFVNAPFSKLHVAVLDVLKQDGFIAGYKVKEIRKNISIIIIELKYFNNSGVIKSLTKISKPGKRIYYSVEELRKKKFCNGLGIVVLSTPKGVISNKEALNANVGGEVLCTVF